MLYFDTFIKYLCFLSSKKWQMSQKGVYLVSTGFCLYFSACKKEGSKQRVKAFKPPKKHLF